MYHTQIIRKKHYCFCREHYTNYCENSLTELPFFHTVHLTCELKMILTDEFKEEKEILTQFDPTYDGVKSSI